MAAAWYWPASLLMLAAIVGVLIALPPADATNAAHGTTANPPAATPTLNVVVVGDFFSYGYAASTDRALRLSVPPTLAALNQIQLANQDVRMRVLFIPVTEATWTRLYKGSGSAKAGSSKAPLINAVKGARVVIAGVGADLPSFATSLRTVMFGARVPARSYSSLMGIFKKGSYRHEETSYLEDVTAREPSGGAVVTLGYPLVQKVRSARREWWSPLRWSSVSEKHARLTSRVVATLDTDNAAATRAAGTQYQDQHLLYADASTMPTEATAKGAKATALKETLAANTLLPFITQAVNDELTSMGVHAAPAVAPITPGSRWVLSVQLPTGIPAKRSNSRTGPGGRVTPLRRLTNQLARGNGRAPILIPVPMIPAPPAPIPRPIAPLAPPRAVGGGGGSGGGGSGTGGGTGGTSGGGTTSGGGGSSSGGGSGSEEVAADEWS